MSFLQMTLTGAALIAAVAIIRLAAGRALPRRVFVLLWAIVVLRLLAPFPSLLGFELPQRVEAAYAGAVSVAPSTAARTETEFVVPAIFDTQTAQTAPSAPARRAVTLAEALRYVWLAGAVIAAAAAVFLYAAGYRRFARAVPDESEEARAWLEAHPLRRGLSLRRLEGFASPLTYGIFRPVILVPANLDLSDGAAKLALEHEYVHARRFDLVFKLVLTAALAVHWFNPAVWLMYLLAQRDIELACDEAVLRILGTGGRADYARALLSMEERRGPLPALRVSFGANRTKERIKAIMKYRKRSALAIVLAAVLTLGLAACAVTGPKSAKKLPAGVEKAVYDELMERYGNRYSHDVLSCADVHTLGFETDGDKTTVYAIALHEDVSRRDGEITTVTNFNGPCVVTVQERGGEYSVVEYMPYFYGQLYADNIQAFFPRKLRAAALNPQKFVPEQEAACLKKAEEHFARADSALAELPPLPEKRTYREEDTFDISRDESGFYISGAKYGEVRIGMSFDELEARGVGTVYDRYLGQEHFLSIANVDDAYAGARTQVTLGFNVETKKLDHISFLYEQGSYDNAPTWFELYRKFTESFGEPQFAFGTNAFTTPDELRTMLKGLRTSIVIWEAGESWLHLSLSPFNDDDWLLIVSVYDVP